MGKVVSIRTGEDVIAPGTPRSDVIAELESALELARSGEIDGISIAMLYRDDATRYSNLGRATRGLIGVIEQAKHELVTRD